MMGVSGDHKEIVESGLSRLVVMVLFIIAFAMLATCAMNRHQPSMKIQANEGGRK